MTPVPSHRVLHEIFESQAAARPQAAAVVFGGQQLTYGELESRANQLARHLLRRGVQRGSNVAMLLPRSLDAYITLLAILKSGAAYVPIDSADPADRIAYILSDSGTGALVTTADLAAGRTAFRGRIVRVDGDTAGISAESPAGLPRNGTQRDRTQVDPQDPCYVIYTSGSTGRPKGVVVEHRNACHLVCEEGRIFGVQPDDRVYQGASLAFDLSVEEIWLAFHAGASLIAATPEMAHAGPDLSRQLADRRVTVLSCVPTLLSMLAEDVPSLRLLILGGETCADQLVARWARPGLRIVNTYGPTETTVIATCADVSRASRSRSAGPFRAAASISSTTNSDPSALVRRARSASPAPVLPADTWVGPPRPGRALFRTRSRTEAAQAHASTVPATWAAWTKTVTSTSWAGRMGR